MSVAGTAVAAGRRPARLKPRTALMARLRRRLVAFVVIAGILVAGYLLWLRDSSLVQVETVTVTGLTQADGAKARAALDAAAREMTTLHVDRERLERLAAPFPIVRSIDVRPDFPNGMRIHVSERRPAALLVSGSRRVPVAADGSLLTGLAVKGGLPLVRAGGALPSRRLGPGARLAAVRVAGALPTALGSQVKEIRTEQGKGVVVPLENGPSVVFGDGSRVRAKWAAAVRVLADPDAAGAEYVDVRIPERPVAGGLPVKTVAPLAPAGVPAEPAAPGPGAAVPPTAPDAPPLPAAGTGPGGEGPGVPQPGPPQALAGAGGGALPNPR